MKRDYNLVRRLLMDIEDMPSNKRYTSIGHLSGYDPMVVYEHLDLLLEHNLLKGKVGRADTGCVNELLIERLTWPGHDFLDASKDESIWKKANNKILKPGVSITFDLLLEWLKAEAKQKLGLGSSPESN